MYLGRKGNTEYQLGKLLFYRFMKVRATPIVMDIMLIYWSDIVNSENAYSKHMLTMKQDRQMKLGKLDSQECKTYSSTNWTKNKSAI